MGIQERKEREKNQRQNEIIDAAEKVFFRTGFQNATMDEVAAEAELSKGTLYLYFAGKEELHFAISIRAMNIIYGMMGEKLTGKMSGLEKILEMGKIYIDFALKHPDYFNAILYFEGKEIDEKFKENPFIQNAFYQNNIFEKLTEIIQSAVDDKSVRDDIPAQVLAQSLWAQFTGVLQLISTKQGLLKSLDIKDNDIITGSFNIIKQGIKGKN